MSHGRCDNCEGIDPASCINNPTAAVPDPRFRDQLAEALGKHRPHYEGESWPWGDGATYVGCICGWLRDDATSFEQHRADVVLPLVDARVLAAANQRAAEELRAMANHHAIGNAAKGVIRDRAAALDADPDPAPEPVTHNHTRVRNAVAGPWSPCPVSCPAAGLLR